MKNNTKLDPKKLYRYNEDRNIFFIDVQLDGYREIYNVWDFSPLYNRDIDEDLVAYLKNSYSEIPIKSDVVINVSVPRIEKNASKELKTIESFKNYFMYLIRLKNKEIQVVRKRMLYYLILGIGLLSLANFIDKLSLDNNFGMILSQGLFVGGWVLFWELFSNIFFELSDMGSDMKIFNKMYISPIEFRYR